MSFAEKTVLSIPKVFTSSSPIFCLFHPSALWTKQSFSQLKSCIYVTLPVKTRLMSENLIITTNNTFTGWGNEIQDFLELQAIISISKDLHRLTLISQYLHQMTEMSCFLEPPFAETICAGSGSWKPRIQSLLRSWAEMCGFASSLPVD